ncbi:Cytochrome P450 2L1 [Penaeus vannamei]|uniref:Cytochrome P450 2L1 n=1 Tax=Penaeus vannamei TaxID=6689 RepID=A0A3R7MIL5_PENVA|nr:Cytochrome P450 2L1 [Penaeus vannamei]
MLHTFFLPSPSTLTFHPLFPSSPPLRLPSPPHLSSSLFSSPPPILLPSPPYLPSLPPHLPSPLPLPSPFLLLPLPLYLHPLPSYSSPSHLPATSPLSPSPPHLSSHPFPSPTPSPFLPSPPLLHPSSLLLPPQLSSPLLLPFPPLFLPSPPPSLHPPLRSSTPTPRPGPWGWPVLGKLPSRDLPLAEHVKALRRTHGDVISIYIFLCNYNVIRAAFTRLEFSSRPDLFSQKAFTDFTNSGISFSEGLGWQTHRRFALRQLKDLGMGKSSLESAILQEAQCLVEDFGEHLGCPEPLPWSIHVAVLNVIWKLTAGELVSWGSRLALCSLGALGGCDRRYDVADQEIQNFNKLISRSLELFSGAAALYDLFPWLRSVAPGWLEGRTEVGEYLGIVGNIAEDYIDSYLLEMEAQQKEDPSCTLNSSDHFSVSLTSESIMPWDLGQVSRKYTERNVCRRRLGEQNRLVVFCILRDLALPNLPYLEATILECLRVTSLAPLGLAHSAPATRPSRASSFPRDYIDSYLLEMEAQQKEDRAAPVTSLQPTRHSPLLFLPPFSLLPSSPSPVLDLRCGVASLFIAGTLSVSLTLKAIILHLVKYPEIQKKVQEELDDAVCADALPTTQDKMSLPYLEATILECLRVTSLAPLGLAHSAARDTPFEGFVIPKDALIMSHIDCCHTDPAYWERPLDFYPEHFLDDQGKVLSKRDGFLPFSVGRRVCLGEQLANVELFIFTAALLKNFSFSAPEGVEVSPRNLFGEQKFVIERRANSKAV